MKIKFRPSRTLNNPPKNKTELQRVFGLNNWYLGMLVEHVSHNDKSDN